MAAAILDGFYNQLQQHPESAALFGSLGSIFIHDVLYSELDRRIACWSELERDFSSAWPEKSYSLMLNGSCLILGTEILALLVCWRSCSISRLLRFLSLCCLPARMIPPALLLYWSWRGGTVPIEAASFLSLNILFFTAWDRASPSWSTRWCVDTTTAASSRIVGDFSFLDAWLGGDAEAYFGLTSLWKSW